MTGKVGAVVGPGLGPGVGAGGAAAGSAAVSVAPATLSAGVGSANSIDGAGVRVAAALAAETMTRTWAVEPAARPVIVQVTNWPVVEHVPEPATAERMVKPAGTVSVKVIGAVPGPLLVTVNAYSEAPPVVIGTATPTR